MLFWNLFGETRAHNLSGSNDKSIKLHNIRFERLQYFTTRFQIYTYIICVIKETYKRRAKIVFVYPYARRMYYIKYNTIGSCSKGGVCPGVSGFNWLWNVCQRKYVEWETKNKKHKKIVKMYINYYYIIL